MAFFKVTHLATELTGTFQAGTQRGACLEAANVWGNQVRGQGSEWTAVKVKAPKKVAEPHITKMYYITSTTYKNSNTPEHGHGDYPERRLYISCAVKADTRRLAQNKAKKINANYSFSGQFGNFIFTKDELAGGHLLTEWEAKK